MQLLTDGAQVRLWSVSSGMNVRILENGTIDGGGYFFTYGKWSIICYVYV